MIRKFLIFLFFLTFGQSAFCSEPYVGEERVRLRTIAGDIVLAFYPKVAPRTVAQIKRLVKAGIYDSTHFFRGEKNFVLQISTAEDRVHGFKDGQEKVLQRIPAEFSELQHVRGRLSMARYDNDPDSGVSSFSILLGSAPHLDGKYTVFGYVERGMDVVNELMTIPRDHKAKPSIRLNILHATWFPNNDELIRSGVIPMVSLEKQRRELATKQLKGSEASFRVLLGTVFILGLLSVAFFFLGRRLSPHRVLSLYLILAFISGFALLCVVTPMTTLAPNQAIFLFLGLLGLFKLFGKFEFREPGKQKHSGIPFNK